MSSRIAKKRKFLIPENISWEKKCVLKNYAKGPQIEINEVKYNKESGKIDISDLENKIDDKTAGFYLENPNFFGIFEDDVDEISSFLREHDSLFVAGVDPLSLGIIRNPGEYGADIVIGEGRALGNPIDFGGSTLGIFSCKKEFVRNMPGRIIGLTKDTNGRDAFSMALQTREQHIRRGRATSNICTNEGLNALASLVFISTLGSRGLQELGKRNLENGKILFDLISELEGFDGVFNGLHFNEFVIRCPINVDKLNKRLLQRKIFGGFNLENWFSRLNDCMLIGTTELHTMEDMNYFINSLREVL
jgi:glycine dehydrogenase subunit 1